MTIKEGSLIFLLPPYVIASAPAALGKYEANIYPKTLASHGIIDGTELEVEDFQGPSPLHQEQFEPYWSWTVVLEKIL